MSEAPMPPVKPTPLGMRIETDSKIEAYLEAFIFHSRWLLLPFFLGLIIALLIYAIHFMATVYDLYVTALLTDSYDSNDMLVIMLTLVDKVLIASLVIMVVIGGYENSVSKLNISDHERRISWLGKLDATSLKLKLATSIVSIATVFLLKNFLNLGYMVAEDPEFAKTKITLSLVVHGVIVATAVLLALLDWITSKAKQNKDGKTYARIDSDFKGFKPPKGWFSFGGDKPSKE